MKKFRTLIITLFAALFFTAAVNAQTVSADATGEGLEVTIIDDSGNAQTINISPGQDYTAPAGFSIIAVRGSGTASLPSGATVVLSADSAIDISIDPATGDLGITATSGSATVNSPTSGGETITASTETQFVAISRTSGEVSQPSPITPSQFQPAQSTPSGDSPTGDSPIGPVAPKQTTPVSPS